MIYLVSDRNQPIRGTLTARVMDYSGNIQLHKQLEVIAEPAASKIYLELRKKDIPAGRDREQSFLLCEFCQSDGTVLSRNIHYLLLYKNTPHFKAEIECEVISDGDNLKIVLHNYGALARDVYLTASTLGGFFEDNFFDLLPGEKMEKRFLPLISK
jgi:beta-mannosidase